jgi:hypothetical protein
MQHIPDDSGWLMRNAEVAELPKIYINIHGKWSGKLQVVSKFVGPALLERHLEFGRQWKVTVFYRFCVKRRVCIFSTKNLYGKLEMILENFARKTCYDYFQAYDVILICSLFVRILYFSYMLYNKKII